MAEVELIELIPLIISFLIGVILTGTAIWTIAKRILKNFGKTLYDLGIALEDDTITKEELEQLIINVKQNIADLLSLKKLLGL